jgi:sensor histidine kinase YesM
MKALRSQMNPHFIFNAINSIQHYVLTNEKELANKYLVKFSKLMRNILDQSKEELITLSDELETVRLYLEIEALRFNNSFNYSLSVSEEMETNSILIPPMLIQPFVENAIWHGLLPKEGERALQINIYKNNGDVIIEIDDNGIGRKESEKFKNQASQRRSLGMEITRARLDIIQQAHDIFISFEIIDKSDHSNKPSGTKVVLDIKDKRKKA